MNRLVNQPVVDDAHRSQTVGPPKPDRLLDRLATLGRSAPELGLGLPFELYHRASTTLRVARMPGMTGLQVQHGCDDGLAVRVRTPDGIAFAASSGVGQGGLSWAVEQLEGASVERGAEWSAGPGDSAADRDPRLGLPTVAHLEEWLDTALAAAGPRQPAASEGWIEVAATVESWIWSEGGMASRTRSRAWSAITPAGQTGEVAGPCRVAARHWEQLEPRRWRDLAGDRTWPRGAARSARAGRQAVLFAPEASAVLVEALVRAIHTTRRGLGAPVGPGWKLIHDPSSPDALMGGTFDDAGFPTRPCELANGQKRVGLIHGPGTYRRDAFRDAPQPRAAHVVVQPGPSRLPETGLLATGVRIHPLGRGGDGDWMLEIDGGVLAGGEPGPPVRGAFLRTGPRQLVERCVASYGESRPSHRGVETPALLFDGLDVRL